MHKHNRREALQSLASIFMLGGAAGTVAYVNREELADWLPAPRRPDWAPWVMVATTVHPEGISREQAIAINSTKIKMHCDLNSVGYTKVQMSDDLDKKRSQLREMREMLSEDGPYNMVTVDHKGRVRVCEVPQDVDLMIKMVGGLNNV